MGEAKRRANRKGFSKCAFCGLPATGRDHVPPKCIFLSQPENLINVPACDAHNMQRSMLDTIFLEFLGLFATQTECLNQPLWNKAVKSLRRHKRAQLIIDRATQDSRGRITIPVEAPPFVTSTKQIARGLYWHHTGNSLGLDTPVSASMWKPDADLPLLGLMKSCSIARGQFVYAFGIASDDPMASVWYMQFHGQVLAGAWTGAVADGRDHLS